MLSYAAVSAILSGSGPWSAIGHMKGGMGGKRGAVLSWAAVGGFEKGGYGWASARALVGEGSEYTLPGAFCWRSYA